MIRFLLQAMVSVGLGKPTLTSSFRVPLPVFSQPPRLQVVVDVCVFAFDLLFVDGEVLLPLPLRERRLRLSQVREDLKYQRSGSQLVRQILPPVLLYLPL